MTWEVHVYQKFWLSHPISMRNRFFPKALCLSSTMFRQEFCQFWIVVICYWLLSVSLSLSLSLSLLLFFLIFLFLSSSMFYFCRIWWKWVQFWIQWMRIESLRQQRHLLGSRWWIPVYLPSRFRRSSLPDSSKNRIATTNYRKLNSIARYDWIIYIHQRATNQLLLRRLRIMHRWSLES